MDHRGICRRAATSSAVKCCTWPVFSEDGVVMLPGDLRDIVSSPSYGVEQDVKHTRCAPRPPYDEGEDGEIPSSKLLNNYLHNPEDLIDVRIRINFGPVCRIPSAEIMVCTARGSQNLP